MITKQQKKYNKVALYLAPLIGISLDKIEDIYVHKHALNVVFVKTEQYIELSFGESIIVDNYRYTIIPIYYEQVVTNACLQLGRYSEIPKVSANAIKTVYGKNSVITQTIDKSKQLKTLVEEAIGENLGDRELMSIITEEEYIHKDVASKFTFKAETSAKKIYNEYAKQQSKVKVHR